MKKIFLGTIILILGVVLLGCSSEQDPTIPPVTPPVEEPGTPPVEEPIIPEHNCDEHRSDWIDDGVIGCGEKGEQYIKCLICAKILETQTIRNKHDFVESVDIPATCTENGQMKKTCSTCGKVAYAIIYSTGHSAGEITITKEATANTVGQKEVTCSKCHEVIRTLKYVNNGYPANGKLSVVGPDLVNEQGEKFQLYGLSTHGMQWFGRYANFDTLASFQSEFGINVIRFAMCTDENGYCAGDDEMREYMLKCLHEGIDAATKLGLYVIIDWHMVGATNPGDKNPLYYLKQSKEFFSYISEYYKDQDNILFEIMNEPNGTTTWSDCKTYANQVIPCIRKNSDGIVLVGNPRWTADLYSVMRDPLKGYDNIMYTYHFYAYDHKNTTQVETAYDSGFPVFISEYGFMESSGDGPLNLNAGANWYQVLDSRNISYVAWNISNSKGSASIFKYGSYDLVSVANDNLKEWGIFLKKTYREKSGLDKK